MPDLKLKREEVEALKSLGTVTKKKNVEYVLIPVQALEDLVAETRTRVNRDDQREKFAEVVSRYTTDADGVVRIPLIEFVRDPEVRPDAPFTASTAQQQSTWAGLGRASRYAFELYERRTKLHVSFDPVTGHMAPVVELHKRTPAEITAYRQAIAEEDKKKSRKADPAPGHDSRVLPPEPVAPPDLSGQRLEPVKA